MKRYSFILLLVFIPVLAFAQVKWLVKASGGMTDHVTYGLGFKPGYKIGFGLEKERSERAFFQTFVMLSSKGTANRYKSIEQVYIETPVIWGYKVAHLTDKTDLYITHGLYAAIGVDGKTKNGRLSGTTFSRNNTWGGRTFRFDCGWNFGIGLDFGRFRAGVEFEMGIIPLGTEKADIMEYTYEGQDYIRTRSSYTYDDDCCCDDDFDDYYDFGGSSAPDASFNYGIWFTLTYRF